MTQQPFSRPGAIDLSALRRPAPPAGPAGGAAGGAPAPAGQNSTTSYAVDVTEPNFQAVIEASMTAPVLLAFYSPSRMPESVQLAEDLRTVSAEFDGRFLAGLVDIDAVPAIAQAMQIPSIPLVVAVLEGRPAPLLQDAVSITELRAALNQVIAQLTSQGVTGRHQPLASVGGPEPTDGELEEVLDPRHVPAQTAMEAGDFAAAVVEYTKLVTANPADLEAAAGLAMARVLDRTAGVDPDAARTAAAAAPDDLDAQTLVADLDLLDGDVESAFGRLVDLVRRTAGEERNAARQHLLGHFAAVGNDDDRVLRGRQQLASALF